MNKFIQIILVFSCLISGIVNASASPTIGRDTIDLFKKDTVQEELISVKVKKPHSPHKATIMALCLPGSAQIYNGQWWKVPILYGGVGATIYGVSWNSKRYKEYRDAFIEYSQYLDEKAANPETPYPTNPAWDKINKAFDVQTDPYLQTSSGQTWFKNTLNNRKTSYKRNRDLCYIILGAIYALQVIDGTVFAHFYDFEIDDNLSVNVKPTTNLDVVNGSNVGLAVTLKF